jgi:hypothetical protein
VICGPLNVRNVETHTNSKIKEIITVLFVEVDYVILVPEKDRSVPRNKEKE